MEAAPIVIAGGGLSGLYAAYRLERHGVRDVLLLEARPALGGRIASLAAASTNDRFDLGPTWYWPEFQPELHRLLDELELGRFVQPDAGDLMVERMAGQAPARVAGYPGMMPVSMRVAGGMAAVIDALHSRLTRTRIVLGRPLLRVRSAEDGLELDVGGGAGGIESLHAGHLLMAMPPRLAAQTVEFQPALPQALERSWRDAPTWMAAHAKYLAVYRRPFWRSHGLSGGARSALGPLVEIHDASNPAGGAALFGFFGVPAQVRRSVPESAWRARCRAQLARLFGSDAAVPEIDAIRDWAADPFTATAADRDGDGSHGSHHSAAPPAAAESGPWRGRLTGIGSEWSPRFPGYVAGAVEAADRGVAALVENLG